MTLRPADAADTAEILALIRELADYERLLHEVGSEEAGAAEDQDVHGGKATGEEARSLAARCAPKKK